MDQQDPRIAQTLVISHPSRPPKFVGVPPAASSPLMALVKASVGAASRLTQRTHEVHGSGLLGSEKTDRLNRLQPEAVKMTRSLIAETTAARVKLEHRIRTVLPVATGSELSGYETMLDCVFQRIVDGVSD